MTSSPTASPSKLHSSLIFAYPTKYTSAFSDDFDEMANQEDATEEYIFAEDYEKGSQESMRKQSTASEEP
jgi:hypothetical protein